MMLWKCCIRCVSKLGKLNSSFRTSRSVFIPIQRRAMPKNVQTTVQLHSFHMVARLCSKSFKLASAIREPRTSRYTSWVYKLDFEQAEEPEIKLPTFIGLWRKKGNLRKTSTSASLTAKAFDCVDYNKLWKFFKEMGIPDHLTCLLRKSVCG